MRLRGTQKLSTLTSAFAGPPLPLFSRSYGEQGLETMRETLGKWFLDDSATSRHDIRSVAVLKKITPLTANDFVDFALVPELACLLITDDYARRRGSKHRLLSPTEAQQLKEASSPYGNAMFPADTGSGGDQLFAEDDMKSQSQPVTEHSRARLPASRRIPSASAPQLPTSAGQTARKASNSRAKSTQSHGTPPSSQETAYTVADSSPSRPCPKNKSTKPAPRTRPPAAIDCDADDSDEEFFVRRRPAGSGGSRSARAQQKSAGGDASSALPPSSAQSVHIISSSPETPKTARPASRPKSTAAASVAGAARALDVSEDLTAADRADDAVDLSSEKASQESSIAAEERQHVHPLSALADTSALRNTWDDGVTILSSQDSVGSNELSHLSTGEPRSTADTSLSSAQSTSASNVLAAASPAENLILERKGGLLADAWPPRPRTGTSQSSDSNIIKQPAAHGSLGEGLSDGVNSYAASMDRKEPLQGMHSNRHHQEDENRAPSGSAMHPHERLDSSADDALCSPIATSRMYNLTASSLASASTASDGIQRTEPISSWGESSHGPTTPSTSSPTREWPYNGGKSILDDMDVDVSPHGRC